MIYNELGTIASITIFVIGAIWLIRQPTSGFVIPSKFINLNKKRTYQSVVVILFVCVALLPIDIGLVKNKKVVIEKILPVQILFDVSLSMAGTDIKPSRFHGAKDSVISLLRKLENYNTSLIAFSGKPLIYMPFSTNTKAMQQRFDDTTLADFNPSSDFNGTAIGEAIILAIQNISSLYNTKKEKLTEFSPGVVILITDGDSNVGTNPLEVLGTMKELNIPIFTLGIGDKDFQVGKDKNGQEIMGYVNLPLLEKISKDTGGKFYKVKTTEDFYDIFDEISQLVRQQEIKKIQYEYFYLNEVLLVVIMILGGWVLFMRRKG